jgi:hypothetical protein
MLRIQMLTNTNVNLTFENIAGKKVMTFDGVPCRESDAILMTEAALT